MLRVGNLERSIAFYTDTLSMKLLRSTDRPEQRYTLLSSATTPRNVARCLS